jgi:microcystin degradation protein MlrC
MTRILLAGLFHETHSFTDDVTGLAQMRIHRGAALLARAGDGSQIDGFLQVAAEAGWEVVPAVSYAATPSGLVDHAVFEAFWAELDAALRNALAGGLDGIFLSLHGAMLTTAEPDVEGELLRRIRSVPGAAALPLFGVFDLHATLTPAMTALADGLVCYRENPHVDARETAVRAARLLRHSLASTRRPRQWLRNMPILWPPTGTGTANEPMRGLEAEARAIEAGHPGILAVNVVAGFSFSDTPLAGLAFGIVAEPDAPGIEAALDRLATLAWASRQAGLPAEEDVEAVLGRILPIRRGPVLLVEPADNIGGGAPGDCTAILRALLRHDVAGAGVILADAEAVHALRDAAIGQEVTLPLGGKGSRLDPGPVTLPVKLLSRSDGRFMLEDRHSHLAAAVGTTVEMGPCAVVMHRGITILLTTHKTPPFDLGQWRSQGIDPEGFAVIGVKAAVAHRRAYDPIAAASHTLRSAGPCSSDLAALPYQRLRRPIYPLDPVEAEALS